MKYVRFFNFIALLLLIGLTTSCGLSLRTKKSVPPQLKTIYFSSNKPYSLLATQLRELLQPLGVRFVSHRQEAPFSLILTNDDFVYDRPTNVNASLPSAMHFTQSANASLERNSTHQVVAMQSFQTTHTLTLNANQVYTTNANDYIQYTLSREMASLIYYWLISTNTKDALQHADHNKTT